MTAEDKFALVIGHSNYSKDPLNNTLNDANDVSEIFNTLGYNVTKLVDGNKQDMEMGVSNVSKNLTEDSMLVFYYADHASQVEKSNYLIHINENISDKNDLKYKSVNLEWILGSFKSSKSRTNIVILDSCRNNPFKHTSRGSGIRGLTVIPFSPTNDGNFKNTAIIYAIAGGEYIGFVNRGVDKLIPDIEANSHVLTFTTEAETEVIRVEVIKDSVIPVAFKLENKDEVKEQLLLGLEKQLSTLNRKVL